MISTLITTAFCLTFQNTTSITPWMAYGPLLFLHVACQLPINQSYSHYVELLLTLMLLSQGLCFILLLAFFQWDSLKYILAPHLLQVFCLFIPSLLLLTVFSPFASFIHIHDCLPLTLFFWLSFFYTIIEMPNVHCLLLLLFYCIFHSSTLSYYLIILSFTHGCCVLY